MVNAFAPDMTFFRGNTIYDRFFVSIVCPAVGAVTCMHSCALGEIGIMSGTMCGALAGESVLAALIGGNICGRLAPRVLAYSSAGMSL